MIPLPKDDATPPVTKIYFVSATAIMIYMFIICLIVSVAKHSFYSNCKDSKLNSKDIRNECFSTQNSQIVRLRLV
jgi:hypothetical protein